MSMIPCAEDCIYQKDGYCALDIPPLVTNSDFDGCVHKIAVTGKTLPAHPLITDQRPPQMPPEGF